MTFVFKTADNEEYNKYVDAFITLLYSIRCSGLSR